MKAGKSSQGIRLFPGTDLAKPSVVPLWKRYACLVAGIGLTWGAAGQTYTIKDLGTLPQYYSEAHGINASGAVVGEFEPTNSIYQHAFYYRGETNMDIGALGPNNLYAIAYAINDSNVIVGESSPFDPNVAIRAFVYSNGVMTDLGTLGGTTVQGGYSSAHGINRSGQIVGEATTSNIGFNPPTHAVLYSGGSRTDLGVMAGSYSNARGINDFGVIVGETDSESQGVTNLHAFVYTNGVMIDLGTLGGAYSSAAAINNSGDIVGEAETISNSVTYLRAFLYRNGVMSDLGTLGRLSSSAAAINSAGQIAGYVSNTSQDLNAFLYDGSHMINLNDYLPANSEWLSLSTADGINDEGQITGSGTLTNGEYHAYLMTPVGTPASGLPVTISKVTFYGNTCSFSFLTQTGHTYEAQFSAFLWPSNTWQTFTNVLEDSSEARVTDRAATNGTRYYRVLAH